MNTYGLKHWVSLAGFALALIIGPSFATATDPADELDRYVESWFEVGRFNGTVLVTVDGRTILSKGYGPADLARGIPNGPETKFRIYSISKQFTNVLIFQLAAEGQLDLDAPITSYLPDYRPDTGDRVAVDHLLRHTSGIPCYINDPNRRPEGVPPYDWGETYSRDEFVRNYLSGDVMFEPGSGYKYSNTGYYLLGLIIESVTGESYEENLRERILQPLGMHDSGVLRPVREVSGLAVGYRKGPGGLIEAACGNPDNLLGAGNLYSTAADLLKWNLALESENLLTPAWREKMFTIYWEEPHEKHAYSLNYFSRPDPSGGELVFTGFSGGGPGHSTDVFRFPEQQAIIVILDNSSQYNHWRIGPDICFTLQGHPPRMPKPLMADVLVRKVAAEGLASALAEYEEIEKHQSDRFEHGPSERDINGYGYAALRAGNLDLAISIFKLNVALHPESWNVYDSLAEAYQTAGRTELSEQNYALAREKRDREATILAYLRDGDFEAARRVIESVRESEPGLLLLTGSRVGPYFDDVLTSGQHEKALDICRIWALAAPVSAGPLFSMARVYAAMEDTAGAQRCYEEIVARFSGERAAEGARRRLETLGGGVTQ